MNIDERLEALTQTVELLAKMQQTTEKQVRRLGRYIAAIGHMVLDHEARLRSLEGDDNDVKEGEQ